MDRGNAPSRAGSARPESTVSSAREFVRRMRAHGRHRVLPASPDVRPRSLHRRAPHFGLAAALIGLYTIGAGVWSATFGAVELYRTPLTGYDPPFEIIAGLLLLLLSFRIRQRRSLAWLFSLPVPMLTGAIAILSPNVFSISTTVLSAGLVAAIYPYRAGFYVGSPTSAEGVQLLLLVASLISVLFGTVGSRWLGAQFNPPIQTWGESLYFTVVMISTIGAAYLPQTDAARWFVVLLVLVGVGTFLSAIVVLFVAFLERRLAGVGERLERAQMHELDEHVIVCGVTPEAQATAHALREAGIRLVVIAPEAGPIEHLRQDGFRCHVGDPSSEEELRLVRIDRARSLVVAQDSDAATLLTVITARSLAPTARIVAVAAAESNQPKLRRAGATEVVGVVRVAAQLICDAALATGERTIFPKANPPSH